jgi:hypothetical protein
VRGAADHDVQLTVAARVGRGCAQGEDLSNPESRIPGDAPDQPVAHARRTPERGVGVPPEELEELTVIIHLRPKQRFDLVEAVVLDQDPLTALAGPPRERPEDPVDLPLDALGLIRVGAALVTGGRAHGPREEQLDRQRPGTGGARRGHRGVLCADLAGDQPFRIEQEPV